MNSVSNACFTSLDYIVFGCYAVMIVAVGLWLSRNPRGKDRDSKDYFLAGGSIPWWAIGASLIASNISAEHFIGMSGSGFRIGLAIAAYEWLAAITLILVAKFLLPQMLASKIYTMPQLTRERYGKGVAFFFSFFWLLVYLFVNLTSVSWLGALAMHEIVGIPVRYGVIGLLIFSGLIAVYGGLKVVVWTDVIQVVFLVIGGLITAWFALTAVSGDAHSAVEGFKLIYTKVTETTGDLHFSMIIPKGSMVSTVGDATKDIFSDIPGLAVILGALWLSNIGYWGFNQYIIQKGLAAKNLKEARKGLVFAAYLKILIPFIVVIPGITAYVMFHYHADFPGLADFTGSIGRADDAYPWLLRNFCPPGIRGVAFAALVAAVVGALAGMVNSASTIFTMDIWKEVINKKASENELVKVGRYSAVAAIVVAVFAAEPLLGGLDQAFQYIQEFTGFIYPGVVVVFGMGLLWKRATNRSALWTTIATIPTGIVMKMLLPEMPFLLRMGYVCIVLIALAIVLTLTDKTNRQAANTLKPETISLYKKGGWLFGALAIVSLIAGVIFGTDLFGSLSLRYLGFESIFMIAALMAFLSLIFFTNAKSSIQDNRAYEVKPELFKTDRSFFVGSMGIVLIIAALYAFFW